MDARGLRWVSLALAVMSLGASAAHAAPQVLIVPFEVVGADVPDELQEQTTAALAKALLSEGFGVVRATPRSSEAIAGSASEDGPSQGAILGSVRERVSEALAQGREALEEADFELAAARLIAAAEWVETEASEASDLEALPELHFQLGIARYRDRREDLADDALSRAVHFDPHRVLEGTGYPPLFVRLFNRVRRKVLARPRGSVEVLAPAGDEVLLNGRSVGRGSLVLEDVLPGDHFIAVRSSWARSAGQFAAPEVRRIFVRGGQTLRLAYGSVPSSADFALTAEQVLAAGEGFDRLPLAEALRANRLGAAHWAVVAEEARVIPADFAVLGVIFRRPSSYEVRSLLVKVGSGEVGRLLDLSFDVDLLSADLEVTKLASDVQRETQRLTRPVEDKRVASVAADLEPAGALPEVAVGALARVVAAPSLEPMSGSPTSPSTEARTHELTPSDGRSASEQSARGPLVVSPSGHAELGSSPRTGQGPDPGPEGKVPWWVLALVGVALGATVGGAVVFARPGSDEASLTVRWP